MWTLPIRSRASILTTDLPSYGGVSSLDAVVAYLSVETMSSDTREHVAAIFDQLLALRESVTALERAEQDRAGSLRGHQTVDVDGAFHLGFQKLQDEIASMEETLATLAEATGDVPRF